jgi:NAD(P)H dehydrogenase (quinone)
VIGVTGATGHIGGAVARALAERGVPQRLVVRDAARAPDLPDASIAQAPYGDAGAMQTALAGVDVLLLVSAAEHPERLAQHRTAVAAAAAVGVQRVVYTSFQGAAADSVFTLGRDHFWTETALREAGLGATTLRNCLYADVLPLFFDDAGVIRGPAGEGRLAAVARRDVTEVALAALLDEQHAGQTYVLTGPEALTLDDVAQEVSEATGEALRYERETVEQAYASRAHYGAEPYQLDAWVSTYTAIAAGEMAEVTTDVERVTGHRATSFSTVLREQRRG